MAHARLEIGTATDAPAWEIALTVRPTPEGGAFGHAVISTNAGPIELSAHFDPAIGAGLVRRARELGREAAFFAARRMGAAERIGFGFSDLTGAVGDVVEGAGDVVSHASDLAAGMGQDAARETARDVSDLAHGDITAPTARLLQQGADVVREIGKLATDPKMLRWAATIAPLVPGVGLGAQYALNVAANLAEGRSLSDAALDAVADTLTNPLEKSAFRAARQVARGDRLDAVALDAARSQMGPAAGKAFDLGLALARGQKIQGLALGAALPFVPATQRAALQNALEGGETLLAALQEHGGDAAVAAALRKLRGALPDDARIARELAAQTAIRRAADAVHSLFRVSPGYATETGQFLRKLSSALSLVSRLRAGDAAADRAVTALQHRADTGDGTAGRTVAFLRAARLLADGGTLSIGPARPLGVTSWDHILLTRASEAVARATHLADISTPTTIGATYVHPRPNLSIGQYEPASFASRI